MYILSTGTTLVWVQPASYPRTSLLPNYLKHQLGTYYENIQRIDR